MKKMFKLMLFALLFVAVASSCKDKIEEEPNREVTYANLAGIWQLTSWNDNALDQGTFTYIDFSRKAIEDDFRESRPFKIYHNMNTSIPRLRTGSYYINTDEYVKYISGIYDFAGGFWSHEYYITKLTDKEMVWVAKDDETDISKYTKVDAVPDDILKSVTIE